MTRAGGVKGVFPMRHSLPLLLFFTLLPGLAGAQSPDPAHPFYLGLAGMAEMSANSQVPGYGTGSGFAMLGGYHLNPNLDLQLQLDHFYYYGPHSSSVYRFRPLAGMKLSLDLEDGFRPYLFLGPGLNLNVSYVPYQVMTSLETVFSIGLGIQLDLGEISIFGEGEYDYLFNNGDSTDSPLMQSIPLEIGFLHAL